MTYEQELKANYRQVRARLFHHNPRPRMTIHRPPKPTPPRPRKIVRPPPKPDYPIGRVRKLLELVSDNERIAIHKLVSERRYKKLCTARQIFYYLAHQFTRASLGQIGKVVGGKDHTTVLHGVRAVAHRVNNDEYWRFHINQYVSFLENNVDYGEENQVKLCANCPHRIKGEEAG